jgi:hypothetical protein
MTNHDNTSRARRFGRPPKPTDTVRSERVVSFVTPAEYRQLQSISIRHDISVSAVIHSILSRSLENESGKPQKNARDKEHGSKS